MRDHFPSLGTTFAGRYQLQSELGRGGFARIYLAEQTDLSRKVALKILNPAGRMTGTDSDALVGRFRREGKLVANLRDPHTVTMYDYGQTDAGLLYMVFEHIDGENLREVLNREGRLGADRVESILRQCLMSLQEAHSFGVLHRDIKPDNIMLYEHLGRRDQIKVLDFGIAKSILDDHEETFAAELTQTGTIVGTPRYMAPEQLRQESLTPATDIFSLGLVAYELLTQAKAVKADSFAQIIAEQVSPHPIRLPEQVAVPWPFRQIIDRMIEKEVSRRFQSAQEVLEALDQCDWDSAPTLVASAPPEAATRPDRPSLPEAGPASGGLFTDELAASPAEPPAPSAAEAPSTDTAAVASAERDANTVPTKTKPRWIWATLAAALLLAGGIGVYGFVSAGDDQQPRRHIPNPSQAAAAPPASPTPASPTPTDDEEAVETMDFAAPAADESARAERSATAPARRPAPEPASDATTDSTEEGAHAARPQPKPADEPSPEPRSAPEPEASPRPAASTEPEKPSPRPQREKTKPAPKRTDNSDDDGSDDEVMFPEL